MTTDLAEAPCQVAPSAAEDAGPQRIRVVTQMRSGTHYLQYLLGSAWPSRILQVDGQLGFRQLQGAEIARGLYDGTTVQLHDGDCELAFHFCHYYHPQKDLPLLRGRPTLHLIGFPWDSFYSDAIVAADGSRDPAPSGVRPLSRDYVLRRRSEEFNWLVPYMMQNAAWLTALAARRDATILRYEDFFLDFEGTLGSLAALIGKPLAAAPQPRRNERRLYWSDGYAGRFDRAALRELYGYFAPALAAFYPEKLAAVERALT